MTTELVIYDRPKQPVPIGVTLRQKSTEAMYAYRLFKTLPEPHTIGNWCVGTANAYNLLKDTQARIGRDRPWATLQGLVEWGMLPVHPCPECGGFHA